jgi:hypothetical protein
MRDWRSPIEEHNGRIYVYLYGNEAFDYLVLAERLCQAAAGLLPTDEWTDLILHGQPPVELEPAEFRALIGPEKYRAHLNFMYGIAVEEALQFAVEEALYKESRLQPCNWRSIQKKLYVHLYDLSQEELLAAWRSDRGVPAREQVSLAEHRDFTYWLFIHRLKISPRPRIASDTRRALDTLTGLRSRLLDRGPNAAYFFATNPTLADAYLDEETD